MIHEIVVVNWRSSVTFNVSECPMFNLLIVSFFTTSNFRLSVINIFTRRNPHLKFLPKEGKTLILVSSTFPVNGFSVAAYRHIPFVFSADSRSYK